MTELVHNPPQPSPSILTTADLSSALNGAQIERQRAEGAFRKAKSDYLGGLGKWSRKNAAQADTIRQQRAVIVKLIGLLPNVEPSAEISAAIHEARDVIGELRQEARELKRRQRAEYLAARDAQ